MKVLLLALNAKFIHSSLALRCIKSYCHSYNYSIDVLETTINVQAGEILKEIYQYKPEVLGISCYIWNMSFIKRLVPVLKKILPDTTIILGGPEVSYDVDSLLHTLEVDFIMQGEGEETWKEYLDYKSGKNIKLEAINGLVYIQDGTIYHNHPRRALDLAALPFVYDTLSDLDHKILYYEASRGCPFQCQYCLSSIDKGVRFMPLEKVFEHMSYFLKEGVKQVKFVDRTYNANKKFAAAIWEYLIENDNGHTNFHFEIAAELLDEPLLEILKKARKGLFQLEIGVQSTNQEVLNVIKRPMPFTEIRNRVLKIKEMGTIHQHLDLIAGLPLEDFSSFKQSFNEVISVWPEQLQLGFLKLLHGSGLRNRAKDYGIVYDTEPPYEVLFTKYVSYEEMLRLHAIEELLERYYNTGRFQYTLAYAFTLFTSPFSFFEQLSLYWEKCGYDKLQHNKAAYYMYLSDFLCEQFPEHRVAFKECVRLDWFMHEFIKEVPECLQTIKQIQYKDDYHAFLKQDEWIAGTIPHAALLPARKRQRKMHIETFSYPMYEIVKQQDFTMFLEPSLDTYAILFDYTSSEVGIYPISKEDIYAAKRAN